MSSIERSKNGWEFDWSRRKSTGSHCLVWGRNLRGRTRLHRVWGWRGRGAVAGAGIKWRTPWSGRSVSNGYVKLTMKALTAEQRRQATKYGVWYRRGGKTKSRYVLEHRLVAAVKYGGLPRDAVVRHLNGNKQDNRPENLAIGSKAENKMDHFEAYREMLRWRERCRELEAALAEMRQNKGA